MIKNLPPFTRALGIALAASLLLFVIVPGLAISALPLYPPLVQHGHVWRILSYPLAYFDPHSGIVGNLMKLLWTGMLLVFFGGELETILHTKRMASWSLSTVAAGGIIFCVLSPDGILTGPAILTMFMLTGFAYLWPTRQIAIFGIFWIKSWIVALVVFILYVIPLQGFNMDISATNVFGPVFGAIAALTVFHVAYRQYAFGRAFLTRFDRGAGTKRKTFDEMNPRDVEQKIDELLDKISKGGIGSLSREERDFLLKHSDKK